MKNKILFAPAFFFAAVAGAQPTPSSPAPNPTQQPTQTPTTTPSTSPATSPTILSDTSINAAYVSNPEELKGLTTEMLRPEHSFPVLGSYAASGSSAGDVVITLDTANKGMIWVEGLSQGKFKAIMKKSPSTYKIPAQKSESGKAVSEGTLFLNPTTKELTIVLGRSFDDADPTSFLTNPTKTKTKEWQYTGTKAVAPTVVTPASEQ